MGSYFLQPNEEVTLSLYNGDFETSENIITRDRILDASFMTHGERIAINPEEWKDKDSVITQLTFNPDKEGTLVAGVSTKAKNIALTAEKFNSYLKSDGVLDLFEKRTDEGLLDQDALESYAKHVKAIYQVGDRKTNDWNAVFGHPIEFIPKENPYENYSGEQLEVALILNGKPLPNQLVYADYVKSGHSHTSTDKPNEHDEELHSHDHAKADAQHTHSESQKEEHGHSHTTGQKLRTNVQGIISVDLPEDGTYYLRTIYMTELNDGTDLTHQSQWATLTFGVTHKHGSDTHTHDDVHEHEDGFPTWIFILGSVMIIGLLFLIFRKN
jgi:hypothetical protein